MEKIIREYGICIGYRIRQERIKQNITQQELAQRLGISYSYLYQVASATASPKYVVLLLFSKKSVFLKIKVAVFLYMFYC